MANIGIDALKDKIDEKIVTNGAQEITAAVLNDVLQDSVDTLADGGNLDDGSVTKDKLQQNVSTDLDWAVASNSYYRNSQAGDVAAKVITTYKNMNLIGGGSLKVTFEQANTADDATLNIDGKGAKPLYYNGARVSSTNSWEANETVEIYYNNYNSGIYYAKRWMVEPVSVSQNTLTIGGEDKGELAGYITDNANFVRAITDSKEKIIAFVKKDGSIDWIKGVPTPVMQYIDNRIAEILNGTDSDSIDGVNKVYDFLGGLTTDEHLKEILDAIKETVPTIRESNTFIGVSIDNKEKIIRGVRLNGQNAFIPRKSKAPKCQSLIPKRLQGNTPFTSPVCVDGEYCYAGHQNVTYNLTKYLFGRYTRPQKIGDGCNISKSGVTHRVRSIVCKGDYLFVASRGNGFGYWTDDSNKAEFRALWDNKDVMCGNLFSDYTHTGTSAIAYTDTEDSPGRGMGCCELDGGGNAYLSASKAITLGDIALFLKYAGSNANNIYIPILKNSGTNVLSIVIASDGKLGLSVDGAVSMSTYTIPSTWFNIKVRILADKIELYTRSKECQTDAWSKIVTVNDTISADTIGIGIESTENVTVYVDDLEYNPTDIELVSYNTGRIAIVNKNDMSLVKAYDLNIRAHDIIIDGNTLYLALNGGMNVYTIAGNLQSLTLICTYRYSDFHYSDKLWAQEMQNLALFSANGHKYIAATCYIQGLLIMNIDTPSNVTFVIRYNDIEKYYYGYFAQYYEWGIVIDYPYVYTTIGACHGLINADHPLPANLKVITGVKVRDITDINNPTTKLITVDESMNPYPNAGDPLPISICHFSDKLLLGYGDKGIAVFKKKGLNTEYLHNLLPNYSSNTKFLSSGNGCIYISDGEGYSDNYVINISNFKY